MPSTDVWEIGAWALAWSIPVVLAGALIIRLARTWSLAVSMVVLVLVPVLATFTGVLGASGFMVTETFEPIAVVLVVVAVVTIPGAVMLGPQVATRAVAYLTGARSVRGGAFSELTSTELLSALGNESGHGPTHDLLAKWVRLRDPSRFVQVSG